jgi:hypothetical protein
MTTYIAKVVSAVLVGAASAAYAASTTVTINAIDANGVGRNIGTIELSDTNDGLRIAPQLTELPPGDHGFHVLVPPMDRTANQRLAWRREGITTLLTLANISGHRVKVTRAICRCLPLMPAAKLRRPLRHHISPWPTLRAAR